MARLWQALMLATAILAAAGARAVAQSDGSNPVTPPAPRAVLLPPIGSHLPEAGDRHRDTEFHSPSHLPVSNPTSVPRLAKIHFTGNEVVTVPGSEYEESRRISNSHERTEAERTANVKDGVDYLTEGRFGYGENRRPSRKSIWDDTEPAKREGGLTGGRVFGDSTRITDETSFGQRLTDRLRNLFGQGKDVLQGERRLFESDHSFDDFISPVTNPFYFEDARSLTEVRPIFLYQNIPSAQSVFRGGNALFVGGQARLAFTDRLSVVVNKVGFQRFNEGSGSTLQVGGGLSEFWLGPKYVFYSDPEFKSLISAGVILQVPIGPDSNYQNTGRLSIVPYLSASQRLIQTQWGTLNGSATGGYSFSTNSQRADFFYTSAHVDFDIANLHQYYPLVEASWFSYTKNGTARNLPFDGRDLANIGTAASSSNLVTLAIGGRYKTKTGRWTVGAAYEVGLIGNRDLFQNRFTIDLIWRY